MRLASSLSKLRRATADGLGQMSAASAGLRSWAGQQPYLRPLAALWARLLDAFCAAIEPLVGRVSPNRRLVAVVNRDDTLAFHHVVRGAIEPIRDPASLASNEGKAQAPRAVELRLRQDQVLQRNLSFPAASREFLGPIIDHRLDRLTPWRRDKVMHGFAIANDGDQTDALTVTVLLTSTDIVASPLRALAERGLAPTAIGAESETLREPLRIDLRRGGTAQTGRPLRHAVGRIWLSGVAALAIALAATSLWASAANGRRAESERHLVKARRLIRAASGGDGESREQALIDEKRPDASVMLLIDKLSGLLPTNTYLREMAVTLGQVRLDGTSGDAPALIPLLAGAGLLNVRFTAPVTRGDDGRDSFEITADRFAAKPEMP